MKSRNLVMAVLLLTASSLVTGALAQENIQALIKKCETMDVIDANIVRNKATTPTFETRTTGISGNNIRTSVRLRQSSFAPRSVINMTLKYSPSLEKEIVAAFRKDQDKAIHEVEQRKNGKVSHILYRFEDSEYSFTIKNDTITINATEGGALNRPLFEADPREYISLGRSGSLPATQQDTLHTNTLDRAKANEIQSMSERLRLLREMQKTLSDSIKQNSLDSIINRMSNQIEEKKKPD